MNLKEKIIPKNLNLINKIQIYIKVNLSTEQKENYLLQTGSYHKRKAFPIKCLHK